MKVLYEHKMNMCQSDFIFAGIYRLNYRPPRYVVFTFTDNAICGNFQKARDWLYKRIKDENILKIDEPEYKATPKPKKKRNIAPPDFLHNSMTTYQKTIALKENSYSISEISLMLKIGKSTVSRYISRAKEEELLSDHKSTGEMFNESLRSYRRLVFSDTSANKA